MKVKVKILDILENDTDFILRIEYCHDLKQYCVRVIDTVWNECKERHFFKDKEQAQKKANEINQQYMF